MSDSRISGLHEMTIAERLAALAEQGWLSLADVELLQQGRQVLLPKVADSIIENVIGSFGLPLAIAPNFIVNGRPYIVPMVVEEPSVVAAVSGAAKLARPDGFEARSQEALLAGQVHVTGMSDAAAAIADLQACKQELIDSANTVHPGLARHGGGVRDIEIRELELSDGCPVIAVHILIETGDAMGANLVNTVCESLAPRIGELCGADVALRILSNLADRSIVTAKVRYRPDDLATPEYTGEQVRDRIVMASDIASVDPYRAATHNKGIMNGVDAVAIATGNDWRAIEAGAHAYASMSGEYKPLATWSVGADGELVGELSMPLRLATVGGTLHANPGASLALRMTGVGSSVELAELVAAVGLAQNFAAIRALVTRGIQEGHMRLHARSAALKKADDVPLENPQGTAAGKVILLGEHAVVYGRHALALPIAAAVTAGIVDHDSGESKYCSKLLQLVRKELGLEQHEFGVEVRSTLPPGMGLGSSAAYAVAIIRAVGTQFGLNLDDERVNGIAFECEKLAHGTPSGIDNSIATFGVPMLFSNAVGLQIDTIELQEVPPIVIAFSSQAGSTAEQVAAVRSRRDRNPEHYDKLFDSMNDLSLSAAKALGNAEYAELGSLMNMGHGLLNAIEVSTPEIERMVSIARTAGAVGAKLTGGGGGGSVVAICPGATQEVLGAFRAAAYDTVSFGE